MRCPKAQRSGELKSPIFSQHSIFVGVFPELFDVGRPEEVWTRCQFRLGIAIRIMFGQPRSIARLSPALYSAGEAFRYAETAS